jgi:hypothetical protein
MRQECDSRRSGQCETAAFVMYEEKLIILVQGHKCLCNL